MKLNSTGQAEQRMNSRFQSLPRAETPLPLVSEAHSADQDVSQHQGQKRTTGEMRTQHIKARLKKKPLTFGDFVAGVYHTWGQRRAKGIIDLAIKVHVIEFRGTERFVIT
jgi:G3E family GTPase